MEIFYEKILRNIPEAILVVNAEGGIIFSSHRVTALLGYSADELCASSIVNCLPDWFTLPATGSVLESRAVNTDGSSFPVEISLSPIEAPDGPLLIAVLKDSRNRRAELAEAKSLREQVKALSVRERHLQTEMDQAAGILEAHLPPKTLDIPRLEISWEFSPCYTLGGDMLKLFPVSNDIVGFCILDVSGHGIPASLLAISLARTLSVDSSRGGILKTSEGRLRRPCDIVAMLNEQYQVLHDGEQFVTLCYGVLEISTRIVRYVSAGHPHPILVSGETVSILDGPINPPIGVIRSIRYDETEVILPKDSTFFLYTDGVTETMSPEGEIFGEERLLEFLSEFEGGKLSLLHKRLSDVLSRFRQGREQTDDVTSVALRFIAD